MIHSLKPTSHVKNQAFRGWEGYRSIEKQFSDNESFRRAVMDALFSLTYSIAHQQ